MNAIPEKMAEDPWYFNDTLAMGIPVRNLCTEKLTTPRVTFIIRVQIMEQGKAYVKCVISGLSILPIPI